ncbi:MAG: hypothetical protein COA71_07120 [SAR86 cluster bacterium]|uniref:DUF4440 domain-containing protein n=1 Tax=SAR86 cluster bacterium TaxID=2030880 RepID=A0A2A5CEH0_9GAMM|nr:DUF4440 domain-containing protein [Gammaproteobacteria bacterium AH-315-E17]PCJ41776.1 MAG: hypothetical protein COA71_07120 [SAR86 cluster bacterium]
MKKLHSLLLQKELSILHDEFSNKTEKLLGDSLWEVSADGSTHTREELCNWLRKKASDFRWQIKEFEVEGLADGLVLVTYWAKMSIPKVSESKGALHSSLWKKNARGAWQMVFHQATKVS